MRKTLPVIPLYLETWNKKYQTVCSRMLGAQTQPTSLLLPTIHQIRDRTILSETPSAEEQRLFILSYCMVYHLCIHTIAELCTTLIIDCYNIILLYHKHTEESYSTL